MSNLLELAERCEKMDRPSRELDAEIWTKVHGQDMYWSIEMINDDWRLRYYPGPPGPEYHALKRYTASLDAALTLVPDGMYWSITRGLDDVGQPVDAPSAFSAMINGEPWCDNARRVWARSPALALCAAALRARAAMETTR